VVEVLVQTMVAVVDLVQEELVEAELVAITLLLQLLEQQTQVAAEVVVGLTIALVGPVDLV
jgi:hypothetical protein